MVKLHYEVIKRHFGVDYSYMFNLNPNPKKDGYELLTKYLRSKGHSAWLVKCKSPEGYIHYHGMIRLKVCDSDKIENLKKAIYKQINNYVGRRVVFTRPDSLKAWYEYIHGVTNEFMDEEMFITNVVESADPQTGGGAAPGSGAGGEAPTIPWNSYD